MTSSYDSDVTQPMNHADSRGGGRGGDGGGGVRENTLFYAISFGRSRICDPQVGLMFVRRIHSLLRTTADLIYQEKGYP